MVAKRVSALVHVYGVVVHYNFYNFNNNFKIKNLVIKMDAVLGVDFYVAI